MAKQHFFVRLISPRSTFRAAQFAAGKMLLYAFRGYERATIEKDEKQKITP